MGMFDELICEYPLPGNPPKFATEPGHRFQTKDLGCHLDTYTIAKDGRISVADFTGTVEFYTGNVCGTGPGKYTRNGEDAEWVEYRATFVDSQLRNIVELERTTGPALPISAMKRPTLPSKEEVRNIEARRSEPMTGRRVYVLFGGRDEGYWAEVVAESEHKLCIKSDDHDLQLMNRCFRDHLIWDSEEEAKANRANKRREWDEERREWQSHVDNWTPTPEPTP